METVKKFLDELYQEIAAQPEIEDDEKLKEVGPQDKVLGRLSAGVRKVYQLQIKMAERFEELVNQHPNPDSAPEEVKIEAQTSYAKGTILTELFWQLARAEHKALSTKNVGVRRGFAFVDCSAEEDEKDAAMEALREALFGAGAAVN